MGLSTLYNEELRAVVRGRFAWLGAGVVLLGLGALAAISTQDTWLDGYGVIAYFLAPLAFIPLAAGSLASPRANRFVESVFTAPVDRRDWLAAKILVLLTIAAAFYLALLPMMLVYVAHVGLPSLLAKFLLWTPGILLVSIAIGALVGVLFIGRSVAPAIATGVGILLFFAGLVPLQELLVAQGYGSTASGHLTLVSPVVLLKNGLAFSLGAPWVPANTGLTWVCYGAVVCGALVLAAWVFLRTQGVESWEATRPQRWLIALSLVALVVLPTVVADANYDNPAPPANNAPDIAHVFSRGGSNLALVDPGGRPPARCCDMLLNRDAWPAFPTGEATKQDLLILLPVDAAQPVTDLDIQAAGESGLQVALDRDAVDQAAKHLETRTYTSDSGPVAADGHHIASGWMARVPISLTPTNPWDIGGNRYPLNVTTKYRVAGDAELRTLSSPAAIEAQVPNALPQMALAALILPSLCFLAAFRRWRRTR
jgi:ABC-type transport system involved in multi-copper enzyme maturation permease subunit